MSGFSPKVVKEIREGFGVLCVAAILVLLGLAIGGDAGEVARAAGILAAVLGLGYLAYALLAPHSD